MKVKELIDLLSKEDPEMEVVYWESMEDSGAGGPELDHLERGCITSCVLSHGSIYESYHNFIPDERWLTETNSKVEREVVVIR